MGQVCPSGVIVFEDLLEQYMLETYHKARYHETLLRIEDHNMLVARLVYSVVASFGPFVQLVIVLLILLEDSFDHLASLVGYDSALEHRRSVLGKEVREHLGHEADHVLGVGFECLDC